MQHVQPAAAVLQEPVMMALDVPACLGSVQAAGGAHGLHMRVAPARLFTRCYTVAVSARLPHAACADKAVFTQLVDVAGGRQWWGVAAGTGGTWILIGAGGRALLPPFLVPCTADAPLVLVTTVEGGTLRVFCNGRFIGWAPYSEATAQSDNDEKNNGSGGGIRTEEAVDDGGASVRAGFFCAGGGAPADWEISDISVWSQALAAEQVREFSQYREQAGLAAMDTR